MAWKNWKKNYHSLRKGNNWKREGFCDWWDFGKDWKQAHNEQNYTRITRGYKRIGGKIRATEISLSDLGWRRRIRNIPGVQTKLEDLTYPEAVEIGKRYGEVERKVLLSTGGYRNGKKTYGKKIFNRRMRRNAAAICRNAEFWDEDSKILPGKDRTFWWIID